MIRWVNDINIVIHILVFKNLHSTFIQDPVYFFQVLERIFKQVRIGLIFIANQYLVGSASRTAIKVTHQKYRTFRGPGSKPVERIYSL